MRSLSYNSARFNGPTLSLLRPQSSAANRRAARPASAVPFTVGTIITATAIPTSKETRPLGPAPRPPLSRSSHKRPFTCPFLPSSLLILALRLPRSNSNCFCDGRSVIGRRPASGRGSRCCGSACRCRGTAGRSVPVRRARRSGEARCTRCRRGVRSGSGRGRRCAGR